MSLFCSFCKPPILSPNFLRNYAIPNPFTSKTSISKILSFEIPKISVSAQTKILNKKGEYRSSLSSPVELSEGPPSNVIIFIKGLAKSTVEGVLKTAFSRFGEVSRVKVITDKKTKHSLGFAYVWFTSEENARAAVDKMNGQFFEGRFIHVTLAKPESCKTRPKPHPYKF